jgi:hypothetical protein
MSYRLPSDPSTVPMRGGLASRMQDPCRMLGGKPQHKKQSRPNGWDMQVPAHVTAKRLSRTHMSSKSVSYHTRKLREFASEFRAQPRTGIAQYTVDGKPVFIYRR